MRETPIRAKDNNYFLPLQSKLSLRRRRSLRRSLLMAHTQARSGHGDTVCDTHTHTYTELCLCYILHNTPLIKVFKVHLKAELSSALCYKRPEPASWRLRCVG